MNWQPVTVPLSALMPWARNPKRISKSHARRLLELWERLGQFQTVAIGPGGEVYDGHQRLSVLKAAYGGGYEVKALQADRALTEDERAELVISAHSGTVGTWDWDALSGWDAGQLQGWGFDAETLGDWRAGVSALDAMLAAEKEAPEDAGPQMDRAEELRERWGVESGQLWALGEHRIICGDCTDRAVVDRVMGGERAEMVWTDPPYGVAVGDKNKYLNSIARSNRIEENLENDTLDEPELVAMLCSSFDNAIAHCAAGGAWYVAAPPGPLHLLFGQVLKERGIWRQTIQWVKNSSTFSPLGVCYHWQAEPIFFGWLPNGGHRWHGGRAQTTVWNIDRPLKSPEHPTMKPVELVERAIENSSQAGDLVFDPFLGSGTTLIACERLGRRCRGIEISPAYVAVTLQRWADLTGKTPELLQGDAPAPSSIQADAT